MHRYLAYYEMHVHIGGRAFRMGRRNGLGDRGVFKDWQAEWSEGRGFRRKEGCHPGEVLSLPLGSLGLSLSSRGPQEVLEQGCSVLSVLREERVAEAGWGRGRQGAAFPLYPQPIAILHVTLPGKTEAASCRFNSMSAAKLY